MRALVLIICSMLVCGTVHAGKASPPFVISFKGKIETLNHQDQPYKLRNQLELRGRARLRTLSDSWLVLQTTASEQVVVGPNSEVFFPVIAWETGDIERIELVSGQMRLVNLSKSSREIVTPVSRDFYNEVDALFGFDDQKKVLSVSVFDGGLQLRGLESEKFLTLSRGQSGRFSAKVEKGEAVFDVLLQGRRVARGELSAPEKIPENLRKQWTLALTESKQRAKVERQRQIQIAKNTKFICQKPTAKLNECAWTCVGNPKSETKFCLVERPGVFCQRQRCGAQGEWIDQTRLSPQEGGCSATERVAPCDY